jgi:hypothetical protein
VEDTRDRVMADAMRCRGRRHSCRRVADVFRRQSNVKGFARAQSSAEGSLVYVKVESASNSINVM